MPILNLKISGKEDSELAQYVANRLTNITAEELNKKPEVIAITIAFIEEKNWFVNRESLEKQGKKSFYLDIKITDSTNLKQEKENYIKAVFGLMEETLENLHEESYVYVEEVHADAYGYGGKTQEYRYIKSK